MSAFGQPETSAGTAGDLTSRQRLLPAQSRTTTYLSELNGVRLPGVCLLAEQRRALSWPKTETNLDVEIFWRRPPSVFSQVSVAEDARFELARGCPQHAFQQC